MKVAISLAGSNLNVQFHSPPVLKYLSASGGFCFVENHSGSEEIWEKRHKGKIIG